MSAGGFELLLASSRHGPVTAGRHVWGELDQRWSALYDREHRGVVHERRLHPDTPSKRDAPKAVGEALRLAPEDHALLRAALKATAGGGDGGVFKICLRPA